VAGDEDQRERRFCRLYEANFRGELHRSRALRGGVDHGQQGNWARRATPRPGAGSSCVMTDFLAGYVVPPGAGLADDPGLKASQHSTGGALSVFETTVEAGPPLHVHDRDDECFYVLDGELSIRCGSDVFDAAAGSFVFLPRGRPHRFWARDTSARLLLIVVPGGIEDYFGQINNASDDVERHRIGELYGIRVVPD